MIEINGKRFNIHCGVPTPDSSFRHLTDFLDERQRKEIYLAQVYERDFHHGTTGHNQLMLIALLSRLIKEIPVMLSPVEGDQS